MSYVINYLMGAKSMSRNYFFGYIVYKIGRLLYEKYIWISYFENNVSLGLAGIGAERCYGQNLLHTQQIKNKK